MSFHIRNDELPANTIPPNAGMDKLSDFLNASISFLNG
jgi:hypothetical protein